MITSIKAKKAANSIKTALNYFHPERNAAVSHT